MRFSTLHRPLAIMLLVLGAIALPRQPLDAREQPGLRACYGVVSFGDESDGLRLMQVVTRGQRLPFYQNRTEKTRHCPAELDSCQLKSFVVPGDVLLVGPAMEDFVCAHFIAPNVRSVKGQFRETIGFVPLSELKEIRRSTTAATDWHGTWTRSTEAEIKIGPDAGGKLKILGSATYGALDPERARRGAVNVGELEGTFGPPRTNMIAVGEGWDGETPLGDDRSECRARLRLFAPYLVVEDNGGCGGNNVSFTGVYMRLQAPGRR